MNSADVVTTTATALYLERAVIEKRNNVYMSKNAVNEADFIRTDKDMPADLRNIPAPRIVYTGAIYEWFDKELFYDVIKENPDKSFIVIGFGKVELLNESIPNLYFIDAMRHSDLISYLQHMQVGIIPFKPNTDLIVNTDPIKHYEYLACNLPVVTTMMPESGIDKPYTFLAKDSREFTDFINAALSLTLETEIINDFLIKNSWHTRAALMLELSMGKDQAKKYNIELENVGEWIEFINRQNNEPIFEILYAIYSGIKKPEKFELLAKAVYEKSSIKYIEKQYLRSLLINNNITVFIDTVMNSPYIPLELKDELSFRLEREEYEYISLISSLCLKDFASFYKYSKELAPNNPIVYLYEMYLKNQEANLLLLSDKELDGISPIYLFFQNKGMSFGMYGSNSSNIEDKIIGKMKEFLEEGNFNSAMDLIHNVEESAYAKKNKFLVDTLKARIMIKQGERESVFKFLKEIERISPNKHAGLLLAELYESEGNVVKAVRGYVRYAEQNDTEYLERAEMLAVSLKRPKISLIKTNSSGCNANSLMLNIPDYINQKYEVKLFHEQPNGSYDPFVESSDLVVTTQANYPFSIKQINIELWHGFPIKGMAYMDNSEKRPNDLILQWWSNVDVISSYSTLFNTTFNACVGVNGSQYKITGAPRNDLLTKDNKKWFSELIGSDLESEKIIMYTPTFRNSMFNPSKIEGERNWSNLFGFEQFNQEEFNIFLEEHKINLFVKLHWVEEAMAKKHISFIDSPRINLITERDIVDSEIDFYELLSSVDLLVTDYSSIFFDYLLLDRPIIFTPTDIESYRQNRGFLLEPYEFWTPGPKTYNQDSLQGEVLKSLRDKEYYGLERKQIKSIIHKYSDFDSSKRVWELIDKELDISLKRDVSSIDETRDKD
jgi:CDP-glycerol glycerophosphotransferase (TagB/SpsB family)